MDIATNIVVGTCLRKHREEKRLTQRELAELMGKPQSFVSKSETGERKVSVIEICDFAMALEDDTTVIVEEIRLGLSMMGRFTE